MPRTRRSPQMKTLCMLRDLALDQVVTVELAQRRHFPHVQLTGVESWLQLRVKSRLLQPHPLYGNCVHYRLTHRAVRLLSNAGMSVSRCVARPLGPQAKRNYYAAALHCTPDEGPPMKLYRPSFDHQRFPVLAKAIAEGRPDPLRKKIFYRDQDIVGYFACDHGQTNFVSQKLRPKLFNLLNPQKYPEFRQLVDADRFRLTITTATDSRAEEIRSQLDENPPPFPAEVCVFPELIHLIPRGPRSAPTLF